LSGFFEQGVFDEANRHRDDRAGIAAEIPKHRRMIAASLKLTAGGRMTSEIGNFHKHI
jgi:hypothetical protein